MLSWKKRSLEGLSLSMLKWDVHLEKQKTQKLNAFFHSSADAADRNQSSENIGFQNQSVALMELAGYQLPGW